MRRDVQETGKNGNEDSRDVAASNVTIGKERRLTISSLARLLPAVVMAIAGEEEEVVE